MKPIILLGMVLLFFYACDSKEVGKQIAKSEYDKLEKKYEKLSLDYKLEHKRNRMLEEENRALKRKIESYKNGFKSMYE